jgi:CMP/dCMP kinase
MTESDTAVLDDETAIVAIDGPAGSGKSSISKGVAARLGFGYLDTGAVYRALAWAVLESGRDTDDPAVAVETLGALAVVISLDPERFAISVGGVDVAEAIRLPRVTAAVSGVARVAAVREGLNALFRSLVAGSGRPGVVVEGRDITTVVAPDASVRILLTASAEVRAARRSAELEAQDAAAVADAMRRRDASDSAVVEFQTAADGVSVVDSTHLDFEQTVAAVLEVVDQKMGAHHGR